MSKSLIFRKIFSKVKGPTFFEIEDIRKTN